MTRTVKCFLVGGEEVCCTAELLSSVSDVFDTMLNQTFKETTQDLIELPEDDADAFEKFIKLAKVATSENKSFSPNVLFGDSKYGLALLKNTYLLASKYDAGMVMKLLQNLDRAVPHKFQDVALLHELNRTVKPRWSKESLAQIIWLKVVVNEHWNRDCHFYQSPGKAFDSEFLPNLQNFHPSSFQSLMPM
eukprot:Platyproteum_vivax@DN7637_c4_g1_i8.p1